MNNGWIKLHRKLLDSSVFNSGDEYLIQLWIYILLKVNHKNKKIIFNGEEIIVKKGQGIFGLHQIVMDIKCLKNIKSKNFRKFMTIYYRRLIILEKIGKIEKQSNNKFTLILVKNWDEYQEDEKQVKTKWKTSEKQVKTNNNGNNGNNGNKDIIETSSIVPDLLNDSKKHIKIVGLYAKAKNIEFENKEKQTSFIKRNLRSANNLKGYDFDRIVNVLKYLIDNADFKWTLESVGKYIDEDLININGKDEDAKLSSFFDKYKK